MHHLITHALDQSAAATPDAVVFRCEENALTYAQCVARTNQLANVLIDGGAQRGDRVGIFLHKSLNSAVSVYAILRAGAAYVPIDPRLPASTVAYLIEHCGIRHLVTEPQKLGVLTDAKVDSMLDVVVGISDDSLATSTLSWEEVAAAPTELQHGAPRVIEDDLAYIMYTSGSTGVPKGIMHTHRSGLSYAQMAAELYGVGSTDVLSNHSHLHFDMSTFDLFSGPLRGATTVIIPEPYMLLPASLSELIQDERLTIWYSVSSALVDLLLRGDLENRDLSSLRWVNFGGETLPPVYLRQLQSALPHARFSNVYGPAEVNQCTYFHVPPLPNRFGKDFVPIGRPWDIADARVVDEQDRPVPPGEQGELLIASSTRMRGYWKDPERTEAAFLRERVGGGSNLERIYLRTGDLVRLDEQGELEFLGRRDRQVKVRGFRIELDGIEATLAAHDAVAEAAVWVADTEPREIQGAVTLHEAAECEEADLLRYVGGQLPPYAVPSRLVSLAHFPYTGSGKIDRLALQRLLDADPGQASREAS